MKNRTSKIIIVVIALLALGAAVLIMLCSTPLPPDAGVCPSPLPSVTVSPSPTPSHTQAPVVTATPNPSPTPSPTPDLPLTGYVIGIDPGHQEHANYHKEPKSPGSSKKKAKVSSGTYGRYTGVYEYVVNLQVSLKLKENLEAMGATVIMTRETHDVNISNAERAQMMNGAGVDCWLRIHANGNGDHDLHGMFMLVPAEGCLDTDDTSVYDNSLKLADALLAAGLSTTGAKDLGISKRSDQTGFNWSKVPVCTIEMGFMTNEDEDKLLISDEYQQKIADGLAQGFADYFSDQSPSE